MEDEYTLLEDPFEDLFTINANSYLAEKIEKITKIKYISNT